MKIFELTRVNRFVLDKHHLTNDSRIDDIIQITDISVGFIQPDLQRPIYHF